MFQALPTKRGSLPRKFVDCTMKKGSIFEYRLWSCRNKERLGPDLLRALEASRIPFQGAPKISLLRFSVGAGVLRSVHRY